MSLFQVGESMTVAALYSVVIGLGVLGVMCVGLLTAILLRLRHIDANIRQVVQPSQKETLSRAA